MAELPNWNDPTKQPSPAAAPPVAPAPDKGSTDWNQAIKPPTPATAPATAAPSTSAPLQSFGRWMVGADLPKDSLPQTNGQAPLDPRTASAGDYLQRLYGVTQTADDLVRRATNTFGVGDRFAAMMSNLTGIGGPSVTDKAVQASTGQPMDALSIERAKTAAAGERLGPVGSFIGDAVGYAPFGALGIASKVAKGMGEAAPIFRGFVGNVAEGTAAGGAAAAGHDQPVLPGMATGAATAAVLSPLAGLANWGLRKVGTPFARATGLLSSPEDIASDTAAAKAADYKTAAGYEFTPRQFAQPYIDAKNSLTPGETIGLSPQMRSAFNQHIRATQTMPSPNADTIDSFGRDISNAVQTGPDRAFATRIQEGLDNMMGTAQPISGQPVGDALMQIEKARQSAQQAIMAQQIPKVMQNLYKQHINPAGWAREQSQFYAQNPDSPAYNQLSGIVRTSGGGGTTGMGLEHAAAPIIEGAAGTIGGFPLETAAASGMQLGRPLLSGWTQMMKRGALQRQLEDLYPATTGRNAFFNPDVGGLLKALALGNEASRGY